ncbi:MAG: iron-containing alcohol dehydrogenase [Gammaproteobacteria bacterium]|nr:iron-containing alcohol dehydrogenase [Gammaproteobacteria bacterium]
MRPRMIRGEGCLEGLAGAVAELGASKVLLVTDQGIVKAGHVDQVLRMLGDVGISVTIFDGVLENPTTSEVVDCAAAARSARVEAIIGLGGGSALDTAKGGNLILTNGGEIKDYRGYGKASKPLLPLIAIPTTAGTGSECQSYALITDQETHAKMACGDSKAIPAAAFLDPILTLTQPPYVSACTGMDALAHALETAVTLKRNPVSWGFSVAAFKLCMENLPAVLLEPGNVRARSAMQLAAAYSGLAIENSMLGSAHSAANPLTAHFGVTHGHAVSAVLPSIIEYNSESPEVSHLYTRLMVESGLSEEISSTDVVVRELVLRVRGLLKSTGLAMSLDNLGIPRKAIPALAREASEQWTARFNPRAMTVCDFEAIYLRSF